MLEPEALRDAIGLSLWAGQMLLQNGADSQRIESTVHRIGTGLGADWMDIVVMPDAIIASTINNHEFRTKVRRAPGRGINMDLIVQINDLSDRVSKGELDRFQLRLEMERVDQMPRNYNRWVIVLAIGLACAALNQLFGGDLMAFAVTFVASAVAMFTRQELAHRHFNNLMTTVITAFVAGIIASGAYVLQRNPDADTALAAAVLLLVPGVPLINAAEDLLNGHLNNGIARGVFGLIVALCIALGLSIAMLLTGTSL